MMVKALFGDIAIVVEGIAEVGDGAGAVVGIVSG